MDKEFKPADGVTLENAMEYAAAIEDAVKNEIMSVPIEQRSVVIGMIATTLKLTFTSLAAFKNRLESEGLATPPSEDQLLGIRMLLRRAAEKDKPEN